MNATELQKQNAWLMEQLQLSQEQFRHSQRALSASQQKLTEAQAQHTAIVEQFTETLSEKDRQVASLEHQIKLLLQTVRGSRQERIDPDQLCCFRWKNSKSWPKNCRSLATLISWRMFPKKRQSKNVDLHTAALAVFPIIWTVKSFATN